MPRTRLPTRRRRPPRAAPGRPGERPAAPPRTAPRAPRPPRPATRAPFVRTNVVGEGIVGDGAGWLGGIAASGRPTHLAFPGLCHGPERRSAKPSVAGSPCFSGSRGAARHAAAAAARNAHGRSLSKGGCCFRASCAASGPSPRCMLKSVVHLPARGGGGGGSGCTLGTRVGATAGRGGARPGRREALCAGAVFGRATAGVVRARTRGAGGRGSPGTRPSTQAPARVARLRRVRCPPTFHYPTPYRLPYCMPVAQQQQSR